MWWARATAYAVAAVGSAFLVLGVAALIIAPAPDRIGWFVIAAVAGVPALAVGALIARHAPRNVVATLIALHGTCLIGIAATDAYAAAALVRPGLPTSAVLTVLSVGGWVWLYIPLALLALAFPDGRLSGTGRATALGLVIVGAAYPVAQALDPAPYPEPLTGVPHVLGAGPTWLHGATMVLPFVLLALLLVSAGSLVRRSRRAVGRQRAQLLWFSLAGLGVPLTLLLCWLSYLLLGRVDLVVIGLGITGLAVPLAVATAIFRHDLYDVDRASIQAITWTLVLGVLTAGFAGLIVLGGLIVGQGSALVATLATAACALALGPVRGRVLRAVERRWQPQQAAARTALTALATRVHAGQSDPEEVEGVLRTALDDPFLLVGVRSSDDRLVGTAGQTLPAERPAYASPVRFGPDEIGQLLTSAPGYAAVAESSAPMVELVRLRLELAGALAEVSSSRARLLHAGYQERRRLERDLHDGAQQRLVTLGLSLRLAQREYRKRRPRLRAVGSTTRAEPDAYDDLLDGAVAELGLAVGELRQIAHGLRPSSLDDGLGPALRTLAARLVPGATPHVVFDIGSELAEPLPDDVATTAYFIASESVTNALKHAEASTVTLHASRDGSAVRLRVVDDGLGGAALQPGSGLAGLADRVGAVGGTLELRSAYGSGTVVEAVLPCGS